MSKFKSRQLVKPFEKINVETKQELFSSQNLTTIFRGFQTVSTPALKEFA